MSQKKDNRGPEPNQQTKLKICALTGGRCYFCNKFLFTDKISLRDTNNSNLAHIVASSPDGPRGNEHSIELSDKIENLMLMCQEDHHTIDQNPDIYTVEYLQALKRKREEQYSFLSSTRYSKNIYCCFQISNKRQRHAELFHTKNGFGILIAKNTC